MELIHGGDWAGYRASFGCDALDFSANVSPLGLPQGVALAINDALAQVSLYPDPLCRELCAALAAAESVPQEYILCGNGAAGLIYRYAIGAKPRRALITAPTFAEYEAALNTVGCEVKHYRLSEQNDFELTADFLNAIDNDIDVLFLCQPNNPTGRLIEPELLQRIIERCAQCGTRVLVDECFLDFLPRPDKFSAKGYLLSAPNLLVLKAFTKLYGMAGIRLGYALCADSALLERMRAAGQPWEVSSLAQVAGVAALRETEYVAQVCALIAQQRPKLEQGLRELGLRVVHGSANYILFRATEALGEKLMAKGVVLRSCTNYIGLDKAWYRTAVRTGPENKLLLDAIQEALQ